VLTEGIAAVTDFEGVEAVTEHLEKKEDGSEVQPTYRCGRWSKPTDCSTSLQKK